MSLEFDLNFKNQMFSLHISQIVSTKLLNVQGLPSTKVYESTVKRIKKFETIVRQHVVSITDVTL